MQTILMNLFNDNLNLSSRKPTDFPLRRHYSKKSDKLKKQLDDLLNEEEQNLLEELIETSTSEGIYGDMDSFVSGFQLATLLMSRSIL